MKKLIFAIAMMAATFSSCSSDNNTNNTTISGRFVGGDVDSVFLERITDEGLSPERMESKAIQENGSFRFDFHIEEGSSPRFYRLAFDGNSRPITLVVAPGDNITLESVGNVFLNYEVEGSEESALVREFCRSYFSAADRLSSIVETISNSDITSTEWNREAYRTAQEAMQEQVRFIGANQGSLAAFYAMRHNIAEQYIPQLDGYGVNIAHYHSVLAGLRSSYPNSPYISIIEQEIADSETLFELSNNAELISYPDIELEDIYRVKHRLSSLDGNVVLLYFWSADNAVCNAVNANLKVLHERYHERGFEVYHVSTDSDKGFWVEAVRQQGHPWVSVYGGENPEILSLYNIAGVPQAFLIDREGDITVPSLITEELEAQIEALL